MPIESYAPELLELYRRGAQEEIAIRLPSYTAANNLRARMHNLRGEMRKVNFHLLTIAERVQCVLRPCDPTIPKGEGEWFFIARPADRDFLDALRAAGIDAAAGAELVHDPNAPTSDEDRTARAASESQQSAIANFMKEGVKKNE